MTKGLIKYLWQHLTSALISRQWITVILYRRLYRVVLYIATQKTRQTRPDKEEHDDNDEQDKTRRNPPD